MGLLKKAITNGDVFVKGLIILILEDIVLYLNVGKTMNSQQINQTADLILKDFNFLRVDDFKLCFENAKRGFYGKQYDRLDGQVIYEWISTYCSDRANEAERINNAKVFKNTDPVNIEGQKKVTEILYSAIKNFQQKAEPKIRVSDEKSKFVQQCFNEFEEIFKKSPVKVGKHGKFIEYKGKILAQVEYIDMKLEEKYK